MAAQDNTRKLLERLADDDDFRSRMESDPVAAFAEYGYRLDPQIVPGSIRLPSKQEIRDDLDALGSQMEASSGWIMFSR